MLHTHFAISCVSSALPSLGPSKHPFDGRASVIFTGALRFFRPTDVVLSLRRNLVTTGEQVCYSTPDWGAEYCGECVSVCLCVCFSVRDHIFGTTRPIFTKLLCMLSLAVARSSSGGVAICYVLHGSRTKQTVTDLPTPPENVTTLTCEMQNFFI